MAMVTDRTDMTDITYILHSIHNVIIAYIHTYIAYIHTYIHTYVHTDRQTDRQTDSSGVRESHKSGIATVLSTPGGKTASTCADSR
eukprot:618360-Amphidinium_carterae.1